MLIHLLFLLHLVLLVSCAPSTGWITLEEGDVSGWADDAPGESLEQAIQQSIRYYRKLPESTSIYYGELTYSPSEMIASLQEFSSLLHQGLEPENFNQAIWERFHVFESVAEEGENLFTGYYEPVIPGSLNKVGELNTPVYARPENLVEIDLSLFGNQFPNKKIVGKVEDGRVTPYFDRREIQDGKALEGFATPIAYVSEVDLFFLQIQGSGVIRLDDGTELQVGYHATNGHPYRSIGARLIRREELTREEVSMQTIRNWLKENPERVGSLLNSNPSYVFFRLLDEGPLGNISVPLTPGRSLAADHRLLPKGGLAYISTEAPLFGQPLESRPLQRFMMVQDTGGAIRGHGRADVFWGKGVYASWNAGNMKHTGRLLMLVAKKEVLRKTLARESTAVPKHSNN